jgi:putative zinc finger/helix-turn-helix YgiT family protein
MKQMGYCDICHKRTDSFVTTILQEFHINKQAISVPVPGRFCSVCQSRMYDHELDQAASEAVISAYGEKFGLSGSHIVRFRKKYKLSQDMLCKFIGIAKKTLISYEKNQALPNVHYRQLLKSVIENPQILLTFARNTDLPLTIKEHKKLEDIQDLAMSSLSEIDEYTGYTAFSLPKLTQMILAFSSKKVSLTRLNKGLFYADFNAYHDTNRSITGNIYYRYDHGPVYIELYHVMTKLAEDGLVNVEMVDFHGEMISMYEAAEYTEPYAPISYEHAKHIKLTF